MKTDWPQRPISDLGDVRGGRQRSPKARGEMRPYLRVANVFDGRIDTTSIFSMPFTQREFEVFRLTPGDILLNEGQSLHLVGRAAMYEGEPTGCAFQNSLIRFRVHEGTDGDFMLHTFRHLQKTGRFAAIAAQTTSMAHLGVDRFARLRIPVPPLELQKRSSKFLSDLDRSSRLTSDLLIKKHQFKQGITRALLAGRIRAARSLDPVMTVELGLVSRELRDRNVAGLEAKHVMGVSKFNGIVPMRERTIGADLDRYKILPPGAFAYNPMRLNIGSIARWQGSHNVLVSPDYVVFETIAEKLDARFLEYYRRGHRWRQYMEAAGNGTVRVRIYYGDLSSMKMPLPSLQEQGRIADLLDLVDREIFLLQRQRELLEKQKRAVMHKLLTGEVRLAPTEEA